MRDEIELLKKAEALRRSKQARQQTIATFCLSVAQMASDLQQALRAAKRGTDKQAEKAADYLERKIRGEFAEKFGHSMIID